MTFFLLSISPQVPANGATQPAFSVPAATSAPTAAATRSSARTTAAAAASTATAAAAAVTTIPSAFAPNTVQYGPPPGAPILSGIPAGAASGGAASGGAATGSAAAAAASGPQAWVAAHAHYQPGSGGGGGSGGQNHPGGHSIKVCQSDALVYRICTTQRKSKQH